MTKTMNQIALATIAGALAILATPASAGDYSHGHGHSYGHVRYAHVQHHSHHSHYKPTHSYGYVHHQPVHVHYKPHYVKPVYVETKTSYEKRPAYVYQKVSGYCVDVVNTTGYQQHRKTVECKAGDYKKAEAPVEQAPAPEPAPVEPQK